MGKKRFAKFLFKEIAKSTMNTILPGSGHAIELSDWIPEKKRKKKED
jgi:hypothetical protein